MQQVYEVNVRTWRTERSAALGRPATLDDLDHDFFDRLVEDGFTWVYLLGVWPTGRLSLGVSRGDAQLRRYLERVLPGFREDDVTGSVFAVSGFEVDPDLGGDLALARLRDRARSSGLALMLDFVPNHTGLDHPWLQAHPEWYIRGDERALRERPDAHVRVGDHVFAHGRDPFFPAWRSTAQLDYANDQVQEAMVAAASSVAARCDGLRCDMAMLLLPDVFEKTWGRRMQPFWRKCLDRVRAEHPGTLFMAEVYWNREWELQQAGFDFTYDKILYDRLREGDAESIRAHLRAAIDYQAHCVRFLENHEEQRAAATFTDPRHYRGALHLAAMVPGMFLSHCGQEEGRALHCSLHSARRPPETGSEQHRAAYLEVMHLLMEPARRDGAWQLLEPRGDHPIIGSMWSRQGHQSLLVAVNASWREASGALDPGGAGNRDCQLQDRSGGGGTCNLTAKQLREQGIRVALPPWGVQVYRLVVQKQ
jgi:hypothetical protein